MKLNISKLFSRLLLLLIVLPGCIFNKSSRNYDCARAAYENILFKYERDLAVFEKIQSTQDRETKLHLIHEFKDEVLLKNEEYNDAHHGLFKRKNEIANYPFTQYKMALDCDLNTLETAKTRLYWKQEGLGKSFQDLINSLDQMRKYVVLCEEYTRERHMMERRKIMIVEKQAHQKSIQTSKQTSRKASTRSRQA